MALETGKFHNIRSGRAWKVVNLLHLCEAAAGKTKLRQKWQQLAGYGIR